MLALVITVFINTTRDKLLSEVKSTNKQHYLDLLCLCHLHSGPLLNLSLRTLHLAHVGALHLIFFLLVFPSLAMCNFLLLLQFFLPSLNLSFFLSIQCMEYFCFLWGVFIF